ncbi:unnamed protein product [Dicrocoelium dendriticum]|nr:unnamed protein product [Dicrocoelium dendriticum]
MVVILFSSLRCCSSNYVSRAGAILLVDLKMEMDSLKFTCALRPKRCPQGSQKIKVKQNWQSECSLTHSLSFPKCLIMERNPDILKSARGTQVHTNGSQMYRLITCTSVLLKAFEQLVTPRIVTAIPLTVSKTVHTEPRFQP